MGQALELARIRLDGGTQPRAETDSFTVEEYATSMLAGDRFPLPVVFFDGRDYWLSSGFHRFNAAQAAEFAALEVDLRQGTCRDAVLFSAGENAEHGMRRTNDDKRRAVRKLLDDAEWGRWSDRRIAEACRVDHAFVLRLRQELQPESSVSGHQIRQATRGGTSYAMNTTNIGKAASIRPGPRLQEPGHREPEQRDRGVGIYEALHAIEMAFGTLPDPRIAAAEYQHLTIDLAQRISMWFAKFAAERRNQMERAS